MRHRHVYIYIYSREDSIRAKIITCSPFSLRTLISDYSYSRGRGTELFSNSGYSRGRCDQ